MQQWNAAIPGWADPIGQIQNNINNIINRKERSDKDADVQSMTHIIEKINRAIANSKALRRASKKIKKHDPKSRERKNIIDNIKGHASYIIGMIANYDIEGSLERAIHRADAQQEDRECTQDTLKKHRALNPYGGEHMTKEDRGEVYNAAEKRSITMALRKACVHHRIESCYETSSTEMSKEDASDEEGWCQIYNLLKQGCEGMNWYNILTEKGFGKQVDETIQRLKNTKKPSQL